MLIGILYTFGPLPISSTPFGDFFIGLAMGFGIFTAMLYVKAFDVIQFDWLSITLLIVASIPTAITVMSVSLANNICDLEEDIEDGRFTLPYHIGIDKALVIFKPFYYAGYIAIIFSVIFGTFPRLVTLSLLTFPYVLKNIRIFMNEQDKKTTFLTTIYNSIVIPIPLILTFFIGTWLDLWLYFLILKREKNNQWWFEGCLLQYTLLIIFYLFEYSSFSWSSLLMN